MKRAIQKGFTLIELVVVIVILGILAAVAIPQFTDMSTAARQAVGDGACGALQSAAVLLYASNKGASTSSVIVAATTVTGGAFGGSSCTDRSFTTTAPNSVSRNCQTIPTALCT